MGKSRRKYPAEFRRQLVELARAGRSAEDLAREFGPSRESIRKRVLQSDRDERDVRALKPDERSELERLRRENRQLRLEREIAGLRWRRSIEWTTAMGQFAIQFGERFPGTTR